MQQRARLEEVVTKGAPAQADRARKLLERLDATSGQAAGELAEEIDLLYDAYLHDPYLTRTDDQGRPAN